MGSPLVIFQITWSPSLECSCLAIEYAVSMSAQYTQPSESSFAHAAGWTAQGVGFVIVKKLFLQKIYKRYPHLTQNAIGDQAVLCSKFGEMGH